MPLKRNFYVALLQVVRRSQTKQSGLYGAPQIFEVTDKGRNHNINHQIVHHPNIPDISYYRNSCFMLYCFFVVAHSHFDKFSGQLVYLTETANKCTRLQIVTRELVNLKSQLQPQEHKFQAVHSQQQLQIIGSNNYHIISAQHEDLTQAESFFNLLSSETKKRVNLSLWQQLQIIRQLCPQRIRDTSDICQFPMGG